MTDIFVKQLDGCTYCSGGQNCTCACHAMWLYRATQGRVRLTACQVRTKTGDKTGGTNLTQMAAIAHDLGVVGTLWKPGLFAEARRLTLTGRYGWHCQIGYNVLANTAWDSFGGRFRGAHDVYIAGGNENTARMGDPGADGRRAGIPNGYQSIPWELLERAASALPMSADGPTLAQEYGSGRVNAYLTPADPVIAADRFRVVIDGNTTTRRTPLYNKPNGARAGAISDASYIVTRSKVTGLWWFRIDSTVTGGVTRNKGRWFKPNRWMTFKELP